MISMRAPGVAQMIQVVLLNLIQVDILLTDHWLQGVLDHLGLIEPINHLDEDEVEEGVDDKPYNYFKDQGYEVYYLLGNLGSTLVFITILPLVYLILGVINWLGKCFRTCMRLSKFLNNKLIWNFAINFYFSQFTPIILACLINLRHIEKASLIEAVSTYLTYFLFSAFTVALALMFYNIKKQAMQSENPSYLLSGLKVSDSFVVKNWKLLVLIRLYITLIILVYMQDTHTFQILTLFILSVISQAFVLCYKPFNDSLENKIEFVNEVLNSIYLYNLLSLTEISSEQSIEVRNMQGWILVGLCLTTVLINLCLMVKEKYRALRNYIRECRYKNTLELRKANYAINQKVNTT